MNYKLSIQEYPSFTNYLSKKDMINYGEIKVPYWQVRIVMLSLNLPLFGLLESQHSLLYNSLFNGSNNENLSISSLLNSELFDTNNEKIQSLLSLNPFLKYIANIDNKTNVDNKDSILYNNSKKQLNIYTIIPEIKKINKNLTYTDLYSLLSSFCDNKLVFINIFKENPNENLISAIVVFPYSPEFINNLNMYNIKDVGLILSFAKLSGIPFNFDNCILDLNEEKILNLKVIKQYLIDLYYLADDSNDIHPVKYCHNTYNICNNLSSSFCENNLCKRCCQSNANLKYCFIHHRSINYYRYKFQKQFEFEETHSFNQSITIKVSVKFCLFNYIKEYKSSNLNNSNLLNFEKLKEIFPYKDINWDKTKLYYNSITNKIDSVYIVCNNNEEARKIYNDRVKLIQTWSYYELNITHLCESIDSIIESKFKEKEKINNIEIEKSDNFNNNNNNNSSNKLQNNNDNSNYLYENSALIVFPLISTSKILPRKSERTTSILNSIEECLKLNSNEYKLVNCVNMLTNENSYNYYIVSFKDKKFLNLFYYLQPLFDCVIVHKLTHLKYFSLFRFNNKPARNNELCLNCNELKNYECVFDLCDKCCSKQSIANPIINKLFINDRIYEQYKIFNSNNKCVDRLYLKIRNEITTIKTNNSKCSNCLIDIFDNSVSLSCTYCKECCNIQLYNKEQCTIHIKHPSFYYYYLDLLYSNNNNNNNDINSLLINTDYASLNEYITIKKQINVVYLIECLKNSNFYFFRPISNNSLTRLMIDMNKELSIVMDNPSYKRETSLKLKDRMYKCFTYQLEKELYNNFKDYTTCQSIDKEGNFYFEFNFNKTNEDFNSNYSLMDIEQEQNINENENKNEHYVNISEKNLSSCCLKEYEDIKSISNESYHLLFYGLDSSFFSSSELIDEIYNELKLKEIRLNKEGIIIIDQNLVINFILSSNSGIDNDTFCNKVNELGTICTISLFDNLDALKLFTNKIKLNLPLVNNFRGQPNILPGSLLIEFINVKSKDFE